MTRIAIPVVGESGLIDGKPIIHSVAFSPDFGSDCTVFVSGYLIGVARSTDGGHSFHTLWDADVNDNTLWNYGAFIKLSLSPSFGTDGAMIATVRKPAPTPRATYDSTLGGGASLHVSVDGGQGWVKVEDSRHHQKNSGGGRWAGDVRLVHATTGRLVLVGVESGRLMLLANIQGTEWCNLGDEGFVLRNGFDANRNTLIMGLGGWSVLANVDDERCQLVNVTRAKTTSLGLVRPTAFGQQSVPGDDQLRGLGSLISLSPSFDLDGVAIAASGFDLYASIDHTRTWQLVQRLRQVGIGAECDNAPTGCVLCRSWGMHKQAFSEPRCDAASDNCLYCLKCDACHTRRVTDGFCIPQNHCSEPLTFTPSPNFSPSILSRVQPFQAPTAATTTAPTAATTTAPTAATTTAPTAPTTTAPTAAKTTAPTAATSFGMTTGEKITLSSAAFILFSACLIFFCRRHQRKNSPHEIEIEIEIETLLK